ncbi:PqqD family protein [Emticicia sp. 17c]|uniref:PqqD family protein n=1 Tax=Emticicia sp. 17c TaxID=3127704 RepID=UPI00301DA1D5
MQTSFYTVATGEIAFEQFDNQTIILNAAKGSYYELSETANYIFDFIQKGLSNLQIVEVIATKFNIAVEEVYNNVQELLDTLIEEEVITAVSVSPAQTTDTQAAVLQMSSFQKPSIRIFNDLQSLLKLY